MNDERRRPDDETLDDLIRDLARNHNEPPPTPRDAIWSRIEATRRAEGRPRWRSPWIWLPAAALFLLAIGIGIGRDTLRQDAEKALVEQEREHGREKVELIYRLAATPVLSRGETLLTDFRSAAYDPTRGPTASSEMSDWAGELLLETRLLLGSPAADDPELKALLEDLELVLTQIRRGASSSDPIEREMILDGLEERSLLARLRNRIPAGELASGA